MTKWQRAVRSYEAYLLRRALRAADGNVSAAARAVELPLSSFKFKMSRWGVRAPITVTRVHSKALRQAVRRELRALKREIAALTALMPDV